MFVCDLNSLQPLFIVESFSNKNGVSTKTTDEIQNRREKRNAWFPRLAPDSTAKVNLKPFMLSFFVACLKLHLKHILKVDFSPTNCFLLLLLIFVDLASYRCWLLLIFFCCCFHTSRILRRVFCFRRIFKSNEMWFLDKELEYYSCDKIALPPA